MFLKVLQEVRHGWVSLKVIEVVVNPEQHYSCYLRDTMRALFSEDANTSFSDTSCDTIFRLQFFHFFEYDLF